MDVRGGVASGHLMSTHDWLHHRSLLIITLCQTRARKLLFGVMGTVAVAFTQPSQARSYFEPALEIRNFPVSPMSGVYLAVSVIVLELSHHMDSRSFYSPCLASFFYFPSLSLLLIRHIHTDSSSPQQPSFTKKSAN